MSKAVRARLINLQQLQTKRILSNNFCVFEPATTPKGAQLFGKDCELVNVTTLTANAMYRIVIKWSIACYVMVREKNGKNKLIDITVDILTPCRHSDINKQVAEAHLAFAEEYPWPEDILTLGWIATAYGNAPSNEQAYTIFDKLGVWSDIVAPWEE